MSTWEEAMERVGNALHSWKDYTADDLATIRKHIEDQAAWEARAVRSMDACCEVLSVHPHDLAAKAVRDLMDANIYQQRRIEELEKLVDANDGFLLHPSEPETDVERCAVCGGRVPGLLVDSHWHPSEPESTEDYRRWQRASEAPTVYSAHSEPETG